MQKASIDFNINTCVIAGGVAANELLRERVNKLFENKKVIFPELKLCTDNAAMVAFLGELKMRNCEYSSIDFSIKPNLKIETF